MNAPFLSTWLPHGTFDFLTERKRSSIREQESSWSAGKSERENEKAQMI